MPICNPTTGKEEATKTVGFDAPTCDYLCDGVADEVQINAAIAAVLALGGGSVMCQRGNYRIDATITMADGVFLIGQGYGTYFLGNFDGAIVTFTNVDNSGVFNIRFKGNDSAADRGITLLTANTYCTVQDCWFEDCKIGIFGAACTYCHFVGNIFTSNSSMGIGVYGNYNTVLGNILINNENLGFSVPGNYNTIEGNVVFGGLNGASCDGSYNTFLGNSMSTCTTHGFLIGGACNAVISNTAYNCGTGVEISYGGCSVVGNSINTTTTGPGIEITLGGPGDRTRVIITGNYVIATKTYGIYCYNSPDHLIITSNLVDSPDSAGANTYHGIYLNDGEDCLIENNVVQNTNGYNVASGIYVNASVDTMVLGNRVIGYDTGINIATGSRNNVQHNILLNNTACFADTGTDTRLASVKVPFVDGSDPQDVGFLIDLATEYARAYLVLPVEVQQVVRMKIVGVADVAETDKMLADFTVYGGDYSVAAGEAYTTHNASAASQLTTNANFAAGDVVYWVQTPAGLLAMLGKDSVMVRVDHRVTDDTNCATDCYFRTVEIEYV